MAVISTIQIDTSQANKSVNDLENELQQINEQLKSVDINSDSFKSLQAKSAELKGQLDTVNKSIDTISKGSIGIFENIAKVGTSISGGITAATAAMQMFGIENEDVMAGIAKLQQMMAITQGISAIKDGIEGFKNLSAVIQTTTKASKILKVVMTPKALLAVTTAVVALVAIWKKFGAQIENAIPLIGKIRASFKEWNSDVEDQITKNNELIQNLEDLQKTYDGIVKNNKISKLNKEAKSTYDDLIKAQQENDALLAVYDAKLKTLANDEEKWNATRQEAQQYMVKREQLLKQINDLLADEANYQEKCNKKVKKYNNLREEDKTMSTINAQLVSINNLVDAYERLNTTLKNVKQTQQKIFEDRQQQWDDEAANVSKWSNQFYTLADSMGSLLFNANGLSSEFANVAYNIGDVFDTAAASIQQTGKITTSAALQMSAAGVQAIGSLFTALADEQDTSTEEGFEQSKKYQISAASMNLISGILAAWGSAMQFPFPANVAIGASMSAMLGALGAVQIAKLSKMKFGDSNNGTLSASSSTISSNIIAPTQYSAAVQGATTEKAIGDSKVYVVESDIKHTGSRVSVQENENKW